VHFVVVLFLFIRRRNAIKLDGIFIRDYEILIGIARGLTILSDFLVR